MRTRNENFEWEHTTTPAFREWNHFQAPPPIGFEPYMIIIYLLSELSLTGSNGGIRFFLPVWLQQRTVSENWLFQWCNQIIKMASVFDYILQYSASWSQPSSPSMALLRHMHMKAFRLTAWEQFLTVSGSSNPSIFSVPHIQLLGCNLSMFSSTDSPPPKKNRVSILLA